MDIWTDEDGTKVADISDLQGYGLASNGIIDLPGFGGTYRLKDATPDIHDGEVTGWRFEKNGQKYLIIND